MAVVAFILWFSGGTESVIIGASIYLVVCIVLLLFAKLIKRNGSPFFIAGLAFILVVTIPLTIILIAMPECMWESCSQESAF